MAEAAQTKRKETEAPSLPWKPLPIFGGLALFALVLLLPPPPGLSPEGWRVVATAVLMIAWWISEAIPVPVTALVPIAALPMLNVSPIGAATAPYGDPVIFLFMGGFVLALAMERSNLHRRIALNIVARTGTQQHRVVAGFMAATAFCSMWVSNTATAVMMLPVALSVAGLLGNDGADGRRFSLALLLSVAYAASIGGITTLIGTPPNALLAGLLNQTYGYDIGFARWMSIGVPVAAVMLVLCWLLLTRFAIRLPRVEIEGAGELIRDELSKLGPWRPAEVRVGIVFLVTATAWIFRTILDDYIPGLSDSSIAILAALVLFSVPSGEPKGGALMDWNTAMGLPWGVLILFGGGLSLAAAVTGTGLDTWIGSLLGDAARGLPLLAVVALVVVVVLFLTEFISNTATAAAFVPLVAALAISLGENPLILAIPATFAAAMAFMLPVATPPNALVFGSGHVSLPQMARNGFWLNIVAMVVISTFAYWLVMLLFGVTAGEIPGWAARAGLDD
ncbi:SLC13 family permease [Aureimonas populi]|uniref:SLC13 family permease n=1 Tax=Aureimonas populi TaxID=1701758 RepID=A0ABW5CQM1_9HYPH|nr:SLC13 family permease [Aureimonas populi]